MRNTIRATSLAIALTLGAGCVVGRHGHVAWVAPPVAIAAIVAAHVGQVWVEGHWDRVDDRWIWSEGYWVPERSGFAWEQGTWIRFEDRNVWRPGRWRQSRVEVRDHTDHRR